MSKHQLSQKLKKERRTHPETNKRLTYMLLSWQKKKSKIRRHSKGPAQTDLKCEVVHHYALSATTPTELCT